MGLDFSISQMRFIWDKNSVRTVQSPLWIASCSGMEKKESNQYSFSMARGWLNDFRLDSSQSASPLRSRLAAIAAEEP